MKLRKIDYVLIISIGLAMAGNTFVATFSLVYTLLSFAVAIIFGFVGAWLGLKIREKVKGLRKRGR